jgi:formyl-CoA transferase
VLTALFARGVRGGPYEGRGQVVDVALAEACLAMLESVIPDYDATGLVRQPSGTRLDGLAPSNLCHCADDRWLIITANQDTVFPAAVQRDGPRRPRHRPPVRHAHRAGPQPGRDRRDRRRLGRAARRGHLTKVLEDAGVVVGPVNTVADVVANPQFQAEQPLPRRRSEQAPRPQLTSPQDTARTHALCRWPRDRAAHLHPTTAG